MAGRAPVGNGDQLLGVASAVRDYAANASEEEKEKKSGQQKWGLFETNSQRVRGISTEQSLYEIEDAAQNGVIVGKGKSPFYGSNYVTGAGEQLPGGQRAAADQFSSGGGASRFGSSAGAGAGAGAEWGASGPNHAPASLNPRSNAGDAFFNQVKQRDARKPQVDLYK